MQFHQEVAAMGNPVSTGGLVLVVTPGCKGMFHSFIEGIYCSDTMVLYELQTVLYELED